MGKFEKVSYGMGAVGIVYLMLLVFSISTGDWIAFLAFTITAFGLEYFMWNWRNELKR